MKTISKKRVALWTLALFVSACSASVVSFYPLYTKDTLVEFDEIIGEWDITDGDGDTYNPDDHGEEPYIYVSINKNTDKKNLYTFTLNVVPDPHQMTPCEIESLKCDTITNTCYMEKYKVGFVKINGMHYADFYPLEKAGEQGYNLVDNAEMKSHAFSKMYFNSDTLFLEWFSQKWLLRLIQQNKIRIRHEVRSQDSLVMLTAKPEELQKFIRKYGEDPKAFDGVPESLEMVPRKR
ncbi:hypothetical protein FUAX_06770 [Fulvitalea axinellae]|uniref:Lipoprotein n=1 Tax=Fulvitalea axinellae TaxID=1182444 RepID=A0AAU9DBR0_9BACT|nr:hypothetical protein FUAX_06770 [Fulvitalea axinellae]